MKSRIYFAALLIGLTLLSGCVQTTQRNLLFVGHKSGAVGTANLTTFAGQTSGDMAISLNGRTYNGSWVYTPLGSSKSVGTSAVFSGDQAAYGFATVRTARIGGPGSILAVAPGGLTLRCQFTFSESGQSGIGECQDNAVETYDLQIR